MNRPEVLPAAHYATSGAANSPAVPAATVGAFLSTWIARPAPSLYVNPPRPEYGPQYNGVGECPF